MSPTIKLGLIGRGIGRSLAPRLHERLGELHDLAVTYEPIDADALNAFDPVAEMASRQAAGYAGLNITHPFKQTIAEAVDPADDRIRRIGAVNTVIFQDDGRIGYNTDFSGFKRAFADRMEGTAPGRVLICGCGGVGRAVAFALVDLGADQLWLFDKDRWQMRQVADDLIAAGAAVKTVAEENLVEAMDAADGLCNCTPIGMHRHPGLPMPAGGIGRQVWAFEAIYAPLRTDFVRHVEAAGIPLITGAGLFLFQGLDAFEIFTGRMTEPKYIRSEVEAWFAAREET